MGWNSWDCYGASVNEAQLRGNAAFVAEKLKQYGWEYVVCDIQWYEPKAKSQHYNNFFPLEMDGFSRLIPAVNRFPSSANGAGFKPIADYVHGLGLKFGIHIMRGIPRQAVHAATPIKGTGRTARDIAAQFSLCNWNTDMYGVNPRAEGAQAYYDSIFELYASWGVDFVKVDDICVTEYKPHEPYSARREIEMIRAAIDKCGRDMVLSLSPGPAPIDNAEHLRQNANMWRLTGDFWDTWEQLYKMFDKCNQWGRFVGEHSWPDCDMLPIGRLTVNNEAGVNSARNTNFTKDELYTLMTLYCVFRSPLMLGCELTECDEFTLGLITNPEVLNLTKETSGARQVYNDGFGTIIWRTQDADGNVYVAFFNTAFTVLEPEISFFNLRISGEKTARDLWLRKDIGKVNDRLKVKVEPHGAVLIKLS
jgi:hypothetical protein